MSYTDDYVITFRAGDLGYDDEPGPSQVKVYHDQSAYLYAPIELARLLSSWPVLEINEEATWGPFESWVADVFATDNKPEPEVVVDRDRRVVWVD